MDIADCRPATPANPQPCTRHPATPQPRTPPPTVGAKVDDTPLEQQQQAVEQIEHVRGRGVDGSADRDAVAGQALHHAHDLRGANRHGDGRGKACVSGWWCRRWSRTGNRPVTCLACRGRSMAMCTAHRPGRPPQRSRSQRQQAPHTTAAGSARCRSRAQHTQPASHSGHSAHLVGGVAVQPAGGLVCAWAGRWGLCDGLGWGGVACDD